MRGVAVKTINQATTLRNWIIGCYIVEYEQNGSDRAKYGDNLLKSLEKRIGQKGLNVTLFQLSRLFYRDYPHIGTLVSANHATALHKLPLSEIYATVSHKLPEIDSFAVNKKNAGKLSEQFNTPPENLVSALSFSHIRELLTIEDPLVRFFYETECIRGTWSVRELRRQIVSNLHIRIGLSEDKMKAMMLADSKAERHTPLLQIRDPYTFEFLGLQAKDVVTESDIEEALLGHLQEFLLEMLCKPLHKSSGINYRLIRLADIYLMYAECLIKGGASDGNVQSAINAINKVRHRAGVVLIGKSEQGEFKRYTYDEKEYAASDVMNHLMYVERPLELCMEGHAIRVIDLRRWNITKERFDQLASDEYKYCMIQTKYLKPNPDDPNALVSAFNFGKQYRFYELPPEKRGNAFVDYFQASLNYGPQVAYWPIPNIEITSNPDINK